MLLAILEYFPCYFKWYRKFRGGNWKYVFHKYIGGNPSCWIHNSESFWFEFVEIEENY